MYVYIFRLEKYCVYKIACVSKQEKKFDDELTRSGILLTLCLGFGGANAATAGPIVYDFSLASNGSVGAMDIQLTFASFSEAGGVLTPYGLSELPVTSFSSVTSVNASASMVGFEVDAGSTLFGIQLAAPDSSNVLDTGNYPTGFFAFTRTPDRTGTFTATGNVTSALVLSTAEPTATLVLSETSAVPEPATAVL